jgi:uncharacterized membrane protein YjgN (DUF898 family)
MEGSNVPSTAQAHALPFVFTGKGTEYFSIWIVNLALTIVTLGIYSAWAKVRKMQYLYRNTSLAGSSFDYHGNPIAILKGRGIAFGALIGVQLALQFAPAVGLVLLLLFFAVMPWMLKRSLQFKMYNSSYRGLRFGFHGSTSGAYRAFLWLTLAATFLGFLWPYTHHQIKSYQHNNSRYGQTDFSFSATAGQFYKVYIVASLLGLGALIIFLVLAGGAIMQMFMGSTGAPKGPFANIIGIVIMVLFFAIYQALVGPYIQSRLQNIVWNGTQLGPHGFVSNVSARKMFFITITNFILIIVTLGLFKPFAVIRLLRYRLENMGFIPHGSLEEFLAGQSEQQSATGEETAEMFDVDISF